MNLRLFYRKIGIIKYDIFKSTYCLVVSFGLLRKVIALISIYILPCTFSFSNNFVILILCNLNTEPKNSSSLHNFSNF